MKTKKVIYLQNLKNDFPLLHMEAIYNISRYYVCILCLVV